MANLPHSVEIFVVGVLLSGICAKGLGLNCVSLVVFIFKGLAKRQHLAAYFLVLTLFEASLYLTSFSLFVFPLICSLVTQSTAGSNVEANFLPETDRLEHDDHVDELFFSGASHLKSIISADEPKGILSNVSRHPEAHYVQMIYPLALIAITGSVWVKCLIATRRCKEVTDSKAHESTWSLRMVATFAVLFNIPLFFEMTSSKVSGVGLVLHVAVVADNFYYWIYQIGLHVVMVYLLPLLILGKCWVNLLAKVRKGKDLLSKEEKSEADMDTMVWILVSVLLACILPILGMDTLMLVTNRYHHLAGVLSTLLMCFSCFPNFFLYCIFWKEFKEQVKQSISCICCKNKNSSRIEAIDQIEDNGAAESLL